MDIEKVEIQGAAIIARGGECGDYGSADPQECYVTNPSCECHRHSRAVLAIALRAAAEEADVVRADLASGDFPRGAHGAVTVRDRLRTLAAQLGGDNV